MVLTDVPSGAKLCSVAACYLSNQDIRCSSERERMSCFCFISRRVHENNLANNIAGYGIIQTIWPVQSVLLCLLMWRHPQEGPASRPKRTVDESKTSCLLHLHADHLYYKKFKSVEAIVAQVNRSDVFKHYMSWWHFTWDIHTHTHRHWIAAYILLKSKLA